MRAGRRHIRQFPRARDDSSFDLMIVDIFMPRMRGFESNWISHEHAPSVPLIVMSGRGASPAQAVQPALMTVINVCLAESRWRHAVSPGNCS